jgi:hypothetical protein
MERLYILFWRCLLREVVDRPTGGDRILQSV